MSRMILAVLISLGLIPNAAAGLADGGHAPLLAPLQHGEITGPGTPEAAWGAPRRMAESASSTAPLEAPTIRRTTGSVGAEGYRLLVETSGLGTRDETSTALSVLDLPRAAPDPGPQRDIAITRVASGPDLDTVAAAAGVAPAQFAAVGEPCRIDWIERCDFVPDALADTLFESLREAGVDPPRHAEPYFYLSRFGDDGRLIISRTASFGRGDFSIVNAIAEPDGQITSLVAIAIKGERHRFETGDAAATVAVLSAAQDEAGAVYLTIDTPSRCGDRSRRAGLLVKTDAALASVDWVSPFNVSDTNVAIRDGYVYAASGGSCEKDYLYELDAATGRVTGRTVLPTAADFIVADGDRLLLDLYEGALAYAFR